MKIPLLFAILFLCACAPKPDPLQEQRQKVIRAETLLSEERTRLHAMQDSLNIKIAENIALGLTPEQAEAIERAFIKTQETLVTAAERNLAAQTALRDSLAKYGR